MVLSTTEKFSLPISRLEDFLRTSTPQKEGPQPYEGGPQSSRREVTHLGTRQLWSCLIFSVVNNKPPKILSDRSLTGFYENLEDFNETVAGGACGEFE